MNLTIDSPAATAVRGGGVSEPAILPAHDLWYRCRRGILLLVLMLGAGMVSSCHGARPASEVPASAAIDSQKYYAVLLTNGAVYFGKLEGLGSPWPVLHDVFYVQPGPVDPNTKQPSGMVLIQRGHELHGPDRMILNEKSIVFVEPVGADSRVAQLIKQAGK
jgi:hypothetical protein